MEKSNWMNGIKNEAVVLLCFQCICLQDVCLSSNRLRVVPLFETVKDLRGAGSVIRQLLSIDWYREHIIKNHNGHQEVSMNKVFGEYLFWEYYYECCNFTKFCWIGDGWIF